MAEKLACDVCVIGAGSAGLSVASGAAQLGARTILFERGKMGGDCLNYGCVPSKALLAAAHRADQIRHADALGIRSAPPEIDFLSVMKHVREAIAAIEPHDSAERFEGLGVRVIKAEAKFIGPSEISGGGFEVRAKRFIIAAGSSPAVPPIKGLSETPYLTNETLFSLDILPRHLLIVGGGPIGTEMAQAFRLLGSRVTIFDMGKILPKDDPELTAPLRERLKSDGITLREDIRIAGVSREAEGVALTLEGSGEKIIGSHLLLAAGRAASVEGLGLDKAGVAFERSGIKTDARLRTSNKKIYAIGDIAGGPQFTHIAGYHAGIVVRNALFRIPAKIDYRTLPWVTYTDPELAHVGMKEEEARKKYGAEVEILRASFKNNDRAIAEGDFGGFVKVVTRKNGRILGASIVGANAGELIQIWSLALSQNLKLGAFNGTILPYPTRGEISKAAASAYFAPKLFSAWPRRLVKFLLAFG
jgi:pyruvate/2-oxoglutarate dehydrogenase complex dihydrolipoamide dehydrogenase (E3) component